jgi:hypothetical protein
LISPSAKEVSILRKGKSFNLTSEEETRIVNYITEMQSSGFELSATDLRRYTLQIAKRSVTRKIIISIT